MKEKEFIQIIKSTLNSGYIGDDCAYLKDLGIVVTQDNLVEDVHFSMEYTTPYALGYKSVMVNISDICASGAEPMYLTIALSMPKNISSNFIKEFYEGAKEACGKVKIVGGDITGSDKIYISATAIGSDKGRKISSRSNAKAGYKIIVSGEHGNSAEGLKLLKRIERCKDAKMQNLLTEKNLLPYSPITLFPSENYHLNVKFLKAHLMPAAQIEFSRLIAENINANYAMMDTSDGLADALMQIAKASGVIISINTEKIPHDMSVNMDTVLYGGEDYQLVAAVPEDILKNILNYTIIGEVKDSDKSGVEFDGEFFENIDGKLFNHFEEGHETQN